MPVVTKRPEVLAIFAEARRNGWVIPAFGTENLTTTEAILAGALELAERLGQPDLPVMLAATNQYPERTQTAYYTHTRKWQIGLDLLLADLAILTSHESPFGRLRVLLHLDHIQHDIDEELWSGDLSRFSSIMFDASTLPFEENIAATKAFMAKRGHEIVVEGACDYIGGTGSHITTVDEAERFMRGSGVDWVVANLGTEHRAGLSSLQYAGDRAREITAKIGPCLVLHGTSSVDRNQLPALSGDGITKVNLWTALERDASIVLLSEMATHAAKVTGHTTAQQLLSKGVLGAMADTESGPAITYFTTAARQQIVFEKMKSMVQEYLTVWYPPTQRA